MRPIACSRDRHRVGYSRVCARSLAVILLVLGLACGCKGSSLLSSDPDTGTRPSDVMADVPPDAGSDLRAEPDGLVVVPDAPADRSASPDARDEASADLPKDAATPAVETGMQPDLAQPDAQGPDSPTEIASRQTVRLTVESERASWAITAAFLCSPFTIERQYPDGTWHHLVLGTPFQCGCECPVAGSAHPAELAAFLVSPTVTWDARELLVFPEPRICPGGISVSVLRSVAQPVPAGHYRATISVVDTLPAECTKSASTPRATCQFPYGQGSTPTDYSLCAHDRTAYGEFDLPSSGDVDVYLLVGGP